MSAKLLKYQESQQQQSNEIAKLKAQLDKQQKEISELTTQKLELVQETSSYKQQLEEKEQQLSQTNALTTSEVVELAQNEREVPNHPELDDALDRTDEDKQPELTTSDIDAPIIVVERSESSKVTDSSNNDVSSERQPVVLDGAQAEGQTATLSDEAEPITCDINKGLESTNSFNLKLGVACEEEQDKPEVVADKSDSKEQGDRNIEELVDNKSKKSNSKKKKKNGFGQESYQQPKKHSKQKLATSGAVA